MTEDEKFERELREFGRIWEQLNRPLVPHDLRPVPVSDLSDPPFLPPAGRA